MMRSMTGYGQGSADSPALSVTVELRSVNNRFADVRLRLPAPLFARERELRAWIAEGVRRGRVEGHVHVAPNAAAGASALNGALLAEVVRAAAELRAEHGVRGELDVATVLALPGMLRPDPADLDWGEAEDAALEAAVRAAVGQLRADREREGENLRRELAERAAGMTGIASEIRARAETLPARLHERLRERLDALRGEAELDPARLAQEAALLADRADVTEELVRLEGHLDRLAALTRDPGDDAVGKRLEFLVQEIHRETNTINSKSADLEVSRLALDLKHETEKVREQVQNVE